MSESDVPGYTYGEESVAESPVSMAEFERLQQTVMWSEEDERHLQMAGDVLEDQIDDVLELWYGFVGDHDFLLSYFATPDGEPIEEYLDRVRERFGQWIRDTCSPPYDEEWLDYQQEIALRHHRTKKNQTDDADSVPSSTCGTSSPSSTPSPRPSASSSKTATTTRRPSKRCTMRGSSRSCYR